MAKYTLKRTGKHGGKVEVRSQHIEIHIPALIICAVLAFVIWIYIVGISQIPADLPPPETVSPETEATTVTPAEAVRIPVSLPSPSVCADAVTTERMI